MKKNIKIIAFIFFLILLFVAKTVVFATNENNNDVEINKNIHIVETENNYIIFVNKEIANGEFKFAISNEKLDPDNIELNYINSSKSEDGNYAAIINKQDALNIKYLYIKDKIKTIIPVSFEKEDVVLESIIESAEKLTNIIDSETSVEKIVDKQKDKVKHEEAVGVLKFNEDAEYKYFYEKSPSDNYKKLKEFSNKLKNEYSELDGYSKIDFAIEFNNFIVNLLNDIDKNKTWKNAEKNKILQESNSLNGDEYVYIIKQVKDRNVKYDIKFLTATKNEVQPKIKEEKIETKKILKFPITGDKLLIILICLIIASMVYLSSLKKHKKHLKKYSKH